MNIIFHVQVNEEITWRLALCLHNVDMEILYSLF